MMRLALAVATCTMLNMGVAGSALAQAKPAPPTSASFPIQVIEASKADKPYLDPRLAATERHLKPFKGQFNRFSLLSARMMELKVGGTDGVTLPGKQRFILTLLGFTDGKVQRVRYQVEMPRTRMKRAVAKGGQTLDVVRSGDKLIIVSTVVQ